MHNSLNCQFLYLSNSFFFFNFRPFCPSTLFQTWETFLQEIEADSVTANNISQTLSRQVIKNVIRLLTLIPTNAHIHVEQKHERKKN